MCVLWYERGIVLSEKTHFLIIRDFVRVFSIISDQLVRPRFTSLASPRARSSRSQRLCPGECPLIRKCKCTDSFLVACFLFCRVSLSFKDYAMLHNRYNEDPGVAGDDDDKYAHPFTPHMTMNRQSMGAFQMDFEQVMGAFQNTSVLNGKALELRGDSTAFSAVNSIDESVPESATDLEMDCSTIQECIVHRMSVAASDGTMRVKTSNVLNVSDAIQPGILFNAIVVDNQTISIRQIFTQLGLLEFLPSFLMNSTLASDLLYLSAEDFNVLIPPLGPRRRLQAWLLGTFHRICV